MNRRALVLVSILCCALVTRARANGLFDERADERATRHYQIHTDLDPDLARELGRRMDAMYDEYAQRLAVFSGGAEPPRLEAYLFRHQRDYEAFTGGRLKNSGGVFVAGQNRLAAFLDGQGREALRRTLQHEAFHQFAYNAISPNLPIWLNEGLAQLFEEGLWNGDGLLLGEVPPRRLRELRADLAAGRLVRFDVLLGMSPQAWADRLAASRPDGAAQYVQAWAMVHLLVMARDAHGGFLYRGRLLRMLALLHEGRDAADAFHAAFGSNVQGFQDRFLEYARTLQATPEATLIENQGVLADLLVDFNREGRRFRDIDGFRRIVNQGRYRLHYECGSVVWDTDRDMNHYFADLTGKLFTAESLYFATRTGAPLPDLICRCADGLELRTRFFDADGRAVEHDLTIEPVRSVVSIGMGP